MRLGQPLPLAVLVEAGVEAGWRGRHHVDPIRSSSNTENLDAVPEVPGRRRLLEHSLQPSDLLVVERVGGLPE